MNKQRIKRIVEKTFNIEISRPKKQTNEVIPFIINQAVNFEKEVIFVAIPKTGTSTVRNQLKQKGQALIPNPHLDIRQIRDGIYFYLLKKTLGTNHTFPNKNMPTDSDLRRKAQQIFDSYFKFSAVRNPWARAVSLYYRRERIQAKRNMSFEQFCDYHIYASDTCGQPTLHKNQLDWLTSQNGEILVDYIYKLEEYEKAIVEIKNRTNGRLVLENIRQNVNPDSMSSNYREMFNDKTRKIISTRFEKDIDYFKFVF